MKSNNVDLYKTVFSPDIGPSLAFIGFVQPASGGLLPVSEMQARWFLELCCAMEGDASKCQVPNVQLPSKSKMLASIAADKAEIARCAAFSDRSRLCCCMTRALH